MSSPNTTPTTPTTNTCIDPYLQAEFIQSMILIDELELKELKEFLTVHDSLLPVFKTPDDLVHVLKVISLIQPNQRISTFGGVCIQCEPEPSSVDWFGWIRQKIQPLCLIRKFYGDSRISNIRAIKAIFIGSLIVIELALQDRENLFKNRESIMSPRNDITTKLKNEQLIGKMTKSITKALTGMQNLKETYDGDAHACALIEMLSETINDRILLIEKSLEFFSKII
jgi:hypothetical protein